MMLSLTNEFSLYQVEGHFCHSPINICRNFGIAFVWWNFSLRQSQFWPFPSKTEDSVLVGLSNYLVALCNFTVMYFFPTWFQTVALTSAATAGESDGCLHWNIDRLLRKYARWKGLHLMPNSGRLAAPSRFIFSIQNTTTTFIS